MTATRHTMPPLPGTNRRRYPISKPEDVKNAVRATGRTDPAKRPAVRRHVIAQAKRLGCSHLIPDTWNSDGTLSMSLRVPAGQLLSLAERDPANRDAYLELAGKWRHGWIPLDAVAAAIKAKRAHGGGRGGLAKSRIDVHAHTDRVAALTSGARSKSAPRVRNPHPGGLVGPKGPAGHQSLTLVGGVQPHEAVRMKRSELEQHAAAGSHVARAELKRRADKRAAMKPATDRAQRVAQDRHRANEAKRAEPQTFTRDELRSASMGTDGDLKRQHAFAVEHGQAEHVTRTHAELEKRGYTLSGGKWTKGGAPAAKAARKPSAVHQDYMRERHAQDMRFEAHTGGGISAKDTGTQEYKDYFGLAGGSGRPVETRLTYKEHLSQRRADPQDKANMAAYDAGMKHGIAHGLAGTSPSDAEYNAASKGHSDEHFGSGFTDGVIAGTAKREKVGAAPKGPKRGLTSYGAPGYETRDTTPRGVAEASARREAAATSITTHDRGNNESLSTGISQHSGGYTALTHSQSKTFKTRQGAERWLESRGYNPDGSRMTGTPLGQKRAAEATASSSGMSPAHTMQPRSVQDVTPLSPAERANNATKRAQSERTVSAHVAARDAHLAAAKAASRPQDRTKHQRMADLHQSKALFDNGGGRSDSTIAGRNASGGMTVIAQTSHKSASTPGPSSYEQILASKHPETQRILREAERKGNLMSRETSAREHFSESHGGMDSMHLQGGTGLSSGNRMAPFSAGRHEAVAAEHVKPGDHKVYNTGSVTRVTKVTTQGSKVTHHEHPIDLEGKPSGEVHTRDYRAGSRVAIGARAGEYNPSHGSATMSRYSTKYLQSIIDSPRASASSKRIAQQVLDARKAAK